MSSAALQPQSLLTALGWRYAVKAFDPSARITEDVWDALERSLVLTPSSYGLQPWKFLVITDPELKARLEPHAWNQKQVTQCSHFVVFLVKRGVNETDVDRWIARMSEVQGVPVEKLKGYKDFMMSDFVNGPRKAVVDEWAARQVYIALGNFMTSAAVLGVDTCPMEGIVPPKFDEVLGLTGTGYATVVACAAGHRSAGDKYASSPKVRYPASAVIERR
jgi:nitroreductase